MHKLIDYPFYEPEKPPRWDLWSKVNFFDELERIWGRKWGSQGIGKLKEVVVTRPTEHEVHPLFKEDPTYFMFYQEMPNIELWQQQHDELVRVYKANGIKVHYMEYPDPPVGAYGPLRWTWAAAACFVIRGGAILPRYGYHPAIKGREPFIAKFLVNIGCPILLTPHGNAVCEIGGSLFIAEDIFLTGLSMSMNHEGLDQIMPVLKRCGAKEIHVSHIPGPLEILKFPAGGSFHPDMFFGPVDIGVAAIYPSFCDFGTLMWLREKRFRLIEIPPKEYRYLPSNLMPLEPGKVIMHAGAKETIKAIRKEGVDVIEIEFTEGLKAGGGVRCHTGQLVRDPGPSLEETRS